MTGIHLSFIGPQVWECQQDTIKMIGSVRELSQGSRLASNELKQQFSRFRQNEIFLSNSPAETLCDSLEEYIESESFDDEEGSSLDESLLLRKFDELRYHILASGLLGGIREDWNVSTFDDETKERLTLEILSGGSGIQVAEGGLLYSSVFGNQVLVFPSQHDYKDTQDLLHALSEVYDATQKGEDWIIDMSCVMNFSRILLGTLFSYTSQLQNERRSKLLLCWVPDHLVKSSKAMQYFGLVSVGGYWFSQELVVDNE